MPKTLRTAPVDVFPHPTKEEARIFFYDARTVRAEGEEKPIIDYIGSDDSEDRYGTIIDPRGWETDAYMRSGAGPVLWAHQYDVPPVGKTIRLTKNPKALVFRVEFAVTQSEFAREIWQLVRDGFLPGVSVGFIPKAAEKYEAETVNSYFAENTRYTKAELLELSVVPVPANRNALKKAYADGKLSDRTVELAHLRNFIQDGPLFVPRATAAVRSETAAETAAETSEEQKDPKPEEHKLNPENFMNDPNGQLCASDCSATGDHYTAKGIVAQMRDWVYVNEQEELEIDEAERAREIEVMNNLAETFIRQIEIGINGWMESKHGALRGICRGVVMNGMWSYDDIRSYMQAWYGQAPGATLEEETERAINEVFAEERAARGLRLNVNVKLDADEIVRKLSEHKPTIIPAAREVTIIPAAREVTAASVAEDIAELRKGAKLSKKNKEDLLKALEILQNLDGLNDSADDDADDADDAGGQADTPEAPETELVGGTVGTKGVADGNGNVAEIAAFLRNGLNLGSSNGGGVTEETRSTDTTTGEQQNGSEPASPPKRSSYLDLIIARKQ